MPMGEDFFNAEFYKFVSKLNRFLEEEEKKQIMFFTYEKSGFVNIGLWSNKSLSGEQLLLKISKEGAFNEAIHSVQEE